jgi:hypothetical protein
MLTTLRRDLQLPGIFQGYIKNITGFTGSITGAKQSSDLLLAHWKLLHDKGMDYWAQMEASVLGLNYEALRPLILNYEDVQRQQAKINEIYSGFNMDDLAKGSHDLMESWRTLEQEILYWPTVFMSRFQGPLKEGIDWLITHLDTLRDQFKTLEHFGGAGGTPGAPGEGEAKQNLLLGEGAVLGTWLSGKGVMAIGRRILPGLFGRGAAAVAPTATEAGGAGVGAAATTGIGALFAPLLAGIGLGALATSGPGSTEWAAGINKSHRQMWGGKSLTDILFGALFGGPAAAAEMPGGGMPHGLAGGASSVFDDIQDWLRGTSSFVPQVRLTDRFGSDQGQQDAVSDAAARWGGPGTGKPAVLGYQHGPANKASQKDIDEAMSFGMNVLGLDEPDAAAMVGRLMSESGLNTGARNPSGHVGVAQWDTDRAGFLFGSSGGALTKNLHEQLEGIRREFMGEGPFGPRAARAYAKLRAGGGMESGLHAMEDYELAGQPNLGWTNAEDILKHRHLHPGAYGPQVSSVSNVGGDRSVTMNANTNISIAGDDPDSASNILDDLMRRQYGDMVRNLSGALR